MNNFELYLLRENLAKIQNKEMSPQLSYAVCQNIEVVNSALKTFDIERGRIVKKYSNKTNDGNPKVINKNGVQQFDIPEDRLSQFTQELEEIFEIENNINFYAIDFSEVLSQDCPLTPAEIATLKTIANHKKEPKNAHKTRKNRK